MPHHVAQSGVQEFDFGYMLPASNVNEVVWYVAMLERMARTVTVGEALPRGQIVIAADGVYVDISA
jgi:hypothetical protein